MMNKSYLTMTDIGKKIDSKDIEQTITAINQKSFSSRRLKRYFSALK
jgi:hypothetical protein